MTDLPRRGIRQPEEQLPIADSRAENNLQNGQPSRRGFVCNSVELPQRHASPQCALLSRLSSGHQRQLLLKRLSFLNTSRVNLVHQPALAGSRLLTSTKTAI